MASIPTSGGIYRTGGSGTTTYNTPTVSKTEYDNLKSQYDALNNNYNNLNNQYNTYLNKYNTLNNEYNSLQNQYKQATAGTANFTMNVGDNQYTAAQQRYNPQATLTQVAQQNALTNPAKMSNIKINQPTAPNTNLNTPTINYRPNAQAVYSPYIKNTQLGNLGDINKTGITSTSTQANYTPNIGYNNAKALQSNYNVSAPNINNSKIQGIGDIDKSGLSSTAAQANYTPNIKYNNTAAKTSNYNITNPNINRTLLGNLGNINTNGITSQAYTANYNPNIQYQNANADSIKNYYDYTQLRDDIYKGIQTAVNQERELAQDRLSNTMANAGLFRSGLTLQNQQQLERSTLDALAKGWGDAAFNVAQLQGDLASRQAELNTNVNLQNSINQLQASTRNAELAADLSKLNAQLQTDVGIQNAQNILQAKLTEYAQKADMLKAQGQLDQAAEFERAKNSLQAQLANQQNAQFNVGETNKVAIQNSLGQLQASTRNAELATDISKLNAQLETTTNMQNAQNLLNAKIQEYTQKAETYRLQGQLDQAAEFERAKNILQSQLANQQNTQFNISESNKMSLQNSIAQLQAATSNATLAADLSKLNAQLQTNVGMQNAQNILQSKLTEYTQKADMLKAQGQLDQAAEFERAKNSLQAQLSNQQKDIELANLNTDIAKTQAGLFQQSNLAGLEARMQQYQTQADLAKTQAALSLDISKYNADIQNAFKTKNYDYLMNAAAQDQEAINQASQFNIQIKNAYDEIAFKWMASLLDKEIRDYQTAMDALSKESAYTLQYGDAAAKQKLANLQIGQSLYNKLFS